MPIPIPSEPSNSFASSAVHSRRARLVDLGCLGVLLLTSWKLLQGLEQVVDLGMWDEAGYLRRGVAWASRLPNPEWGPLYSLWYFVLSGPWRDPVSLYYVSYGLLGVLTPLGTYAVMRKWGARWSHALLGASVYLLSAAPHVLPRPTLLALLVLLLALGVASELQAAEDFWAVVSGGLCVASFARPELFTSFLLATLLWLGWLVYRCRREGPAWLSRSSRRFLVWALLVGGLLGGLGNPSGNTSDRRFQAFCQHFAFNYTEHTHGPLNPWNQCTQVVHSVFGEVDTLEGVLKGNPEALRWHLGVNLRAFAGASLALFAEGFGGLSALEGPWDAGRWGRALLLALVGGQGVLMLSGLRRWRAALADPWLRRWALVFVLVEVPTLVSSVLLMPRAHYLVLQGVLLLVGLGVFCSRVETWESARSLEAGLGVLLATSLLVLTPNLAQRFPSGTQGPEHHLAQLHVVRAIQALERAERFTPGEDIHLLEERGGLDAYLGRRYRSRMAHAVSTPFRERLLNEHVDLLVLDEALRTDPGLSQDADFLAFQRHPETFGFTLVPLPAAHEALAYRSPGSDVDARRADSNGRAPTH